MSTNADLPEEEPTSEMEMEEVEPSAEAEYKEKWQRAVADLDNARKRFDIDRQNVAKYSLESFIEELLPVVDNFYRATEHVPADQIDSAWVTGIQYIQKNLLDVLDRHGVQEIAVKAGEHFDPSKHHGVEAIESAEHPEETIARVSLRGYRLHDRVLRPASVVVYKKPSSEK